MTSYPQFIALLLAEASPSTPANLGQLLVQGAITLVCSAIAAYVTYLVTRPKQKVEIVKTEEEIMRGLREDLYALVDRFSELAEDTRELEEQHDIIKRKYHNLREDSMLLFESIEERLTGQCVFPEIAVKMEKMKKRYSLTEWYAERVDTTEAP